jgi:dihydroorotate dehydrogenase subfamily 1
MMCKEWLEAPYRLGGKQVRGRFVVPSGIRCTHASTIARCFAEVPSIGAITTKSVSLAPRAGYREPIYARYAEGCYINAVGLTNPGAVAFRAELETIRVPADKFLLVSIFGGSAEEFLEAARVLAPVADGFELNMSCPHAKGYGAEIGADRALLVEITGAVAKAMDVPVFVKFSGILPDLTGAAKAVLAAGAQGLTLINTVGPGMATFDGAPVLRNGVGGLSGTGIRPLGVRAVRQIRTAVGPEPTIIGMGGVENREHAKEYVAAGADLIGVGSAATGLDTQQYAAFFAGLAGAPMPVAPGTPMGYFPATVESVDQLSPDLFKIVLGSLPEGYAPGELAGKFFFLMLPDTGEKPFAVFSAAERSVIVRPVGVFTRALGAAAAGTKIYLRGPYGKPLPEFHGKRIAFAGGGTGTASLLEIARRCAPANELEFVLGARSAGGLFGLDEFRALGTVHVATDDGSAGRKGYVHEALASVAPSLAGDLVFINCGPAPMVRACFEVESRMVPNERIFGSIEYMTSCGVGVCGKCASPSGALTCIDGPFLNRVEFEA